ncbi:hypothetical protein HCA69_15425 [Listeria grandensis]|uniref:DNA-binding protein n=1 Tax=Listeria grandensis TaxID=1494963 RepID=A0A7X0Y743_9LIST|nr:hypothetical protein [Listeria grandensis]MBC1937759.1 hypothetical protein [Listeria grandensis]
MNKYEDIEQFLKQNDYTFQDVVDALGVIPATEASESLGKHSGYIRQMYVKFPEIFKSGSIVKLSKTYLITQDGINYLKKNS